MKTLTARSSITTCITLILLTAAALSAVDRFGRKSRIFGDTGGIQAQQVMKRQVDTPADAYRVWKSAGYRGRTVVYVADRWESFDPGELLPAQMFRAYPLQLYNTARRIEDENLNSVTFLYAASLNSICRGIVAILPTREISRLQGVARKAKDYRTSDKGVFVSRQGYPRWFTTAASFAATGEPVLLYVGASYFNQAEPEELYRQLFAAGLQTDCVILCSETGKETVTYKEIAKLNRFARLLGMVTTLAQPLPAPTV